MLWGQIVWSRHPYAEIVKLDTSAAANAAGVVRVLTAKGVPGLNGHGRTTPDQPVFCTDRARYTGDIVALVVAKTREQAKEAAKLVEVVYRPLRGFFSVDEALQALVLSIFEGLLIVIVSIYWPMIGMRLLAGGAAGGLR